MISPEAYSHLRPRHGCCQCTMLLRAGFTQPIPLWGWPSSVGGSHSSWQECGNSQEETSSAPRVSTHPSKFNAYLVSVEVLTLYGAFWMSYATIFIPSSGIIAAYASQQEFANAFGMYLIVWFMLTLLFMYDVFISGIR